MRSPVLSARPRGDRADRPVVAWGVARWSSTLRLLLLAWLLLGPVFTAPVGAAGDEAAGLVSSGANSREDAQRPAKPRWMRRWSRPNERENVAVLTAFSDVVSEAAAGTVVIYCNGEPAALGAVVDPNGLVLTKASELRGSIECRLRDNSRHPAHVLGVASDHDLAMLRIANGEAQRLPTVRWESGPPPTSGSWVATSGQQKLPLAIGVTSASPRSITASRGILGISLEQAQQGPRVQRVLPDSAAADAGLEVGDVITRLNDAPMETQELLIQSIGRLLPGDTVRLAVLRGGRRMTIEATLADAAASIEKEAVFLRSLGRELSRRNAGFPLVIQHDTVLKPNECGGPLVNLDGKVVGINIASADRVSSYAIPASVIVPLLAELRSGRLLPRSKTVAIDDASRREQLSKSLAEERRKFRVIERRHNDAVSAVRDAEQAISQRGTSLERDTALDLARRRKKLAESEARETRARIRQLTDQVESAEANQLSLANQK